MLANNIIRINGWKNGKRAHVDVEVQMQTLEFKNSEGKTIQVQAPKHLYDPAETGFNLGLEGVTSVNMWNWVGNHRITEKIL